MCGNFLKNMLLYSLIRCKKINNIKKIKLCQIKVIATELVVRW
jgi:hypothetical protein